MSKKNRKVSTISYADFMHEQLVEDPEFAEMYLETALEEYQQDNDEKILLIALGQIARANNNGLTNLAKKTGLSREALYKTLSLNGNPRFTTLKLILDALGYEIAFKKKSVKSN